jgi:hypothetical protein
MLRRRYVEQIAQAERLKRHAQQMHYPQFRDTLLVMAMEKAKRAQWIADSIIAVGDKLPATPEHLSTEANSWHHLLMDLEEENRSAEHLTELIWSIDAEHADIAELLQGMNEADKRDRHAIREMLMRSDPFALSLA